MSWQNYVDSNLMGSGKVCKAAILGLQGGVWASSKGYALSVDEQKAIVASFNNSEHTTSNGIRLSGNKFFTLEAGKEFVNLKKGGDGALLLKTKQAVLVAEYAAPIQAPEANMVAQSLADYLRSVGY